MAKDCPAIAIDHLELYVGNAKQSAYVYQQQFGFALTAYRGLETDTTSPLRENRHTASYLLEQGDVRLVISGGLTPATPIGDWVKRHGDGVAVIAFQVEDAHEAYHLAVDRGAIPAVQPTTLDDGLGYFRYAAIQAYGDILLKFVERSPNTTAFAPGFRALSSLTGDMPPLRDHHPLFSQVDHVVANVEAGKMDYWTQFFRDVLGFELLVQFDDRTITTGQSALMSKVLQDPTGRIKLPINEPGQGHKTSQITEFLHYHQGPGVQHVALQTSDIIQTVHWLKTQGVRFLQPPPLYYETVEARVGAIAEDLEQLRTLGILVDRDRQGYLLQIFTEPLSDRPTLFFEIIQRNGAIGFGEGNFKALFTSIEREQEKRGNSYIN
ncbi:MAG: 4-hydroxyphenylpyruvate dioxygenase [Cyanothece sp. SIO2G6]|nr:4-hydroxyphenylpyruvate dioxygenase [Cyanothece sp. SIO2G6]